MGFFYSDTFLFSNFEFCKKGKSEGILSPHPIGRRMFHSIVLFTVILFVGFVNFLLLDVSDHSSSCLSWM